MPASVPTQTVDFTSQEQTSEQATAEGIRELKREAAGIPARTTADKAGQKAQEQWRLMYLSRNSYTVAPSNPAGNMSRGRVPSRTSVFSGQSSRMPQGLGNTRFRSN